MFTEKFVDYLQNHNITAYRVAKETGISQGLMNEYRSGKKLPTLQNIKKIADYLQCSVDYLLDRETEMNFTSEELKVLKAYRAKPEEIKKAARGLLGVDETT